MARIRRRDFVRSTLAATACAVAPWGALHAQGSAAGTGAAAATPSRAAAGEASHVAPRNSDVAATANVSEGTGSIDAVGLSGNRISLMRADVDELGANLRGQLVLAGDATYDTARRLWNGAFDRHPALVARCAGAADVVEAVNFARATGVLTAVRGGGHSISGQSVCDGGLVIDLSPMKGIRVDPARRRAQAQPGVLLGELDRECQAFRLATTLGTASDTGIAGLTLGGGMGRLARKFGYTCDNLLSVDLVTADGKLLQADASKNTDLYWAVRGGGGNFGVVTQFEYQLHPFGPEVMAGTILFPFAAAGRVVKAAMELNEHAPDDLYLNPIFSRFPDGRYVGLEVCYYGAPAEGERLLAPLKRAGKVVADDVGLRTYLEIQSSYDPGLPAREAYYFKSGFLRKVTPAMVDEIVAAYEHAPPSLLGAPLIHLGGVAGRVAPDATAFWNRDADHDLAVWASWQDPAQNERIIGEVRAFWAKLEHLTKGYYINTDTPDDERRLRETYGGNYDRLVQIKTKFDPTNLFRLNANIKPRA
jgi:FAD/FMN-containing dehydrogenase